VRLFNSQPLRRQIVVLTSVMLLLYAVVAVWASTRTRAEREAEVREQAQSIAITAAAYLRQYLTGIDSMASVLVRHPAVLALDREPCDTLFADVLRDQPMLLNVVLTDAAGTVNGTGLPARAGLRPAMVQPYIHDAVMSGKPVVSEVISGIVTGKPTIVLAYPVRSTSGAVVGVLGLGIDLMQLQTVFSHIPLAEGSVITVTDSASRVLARSRDSERYIGQRIEVNSAAPRDVPKARVLAGIDGVERFYGNAVVERGPWLLSVGIPTSVAAARAAPTLRRNLVIALVVSVVITLLALWGSQLISGGLNRLRAAAQRIADGDLTPPVRTVEPNLELAHLQDAFITMASNLHETRVALDRQVEQERKMHETMQSLQRQVVRQERLAAVGVLVSGVAHELNNPLQAILGTLELLERNRGLAPEVLEEIAFVKTQSGRAREIIRNLSRFSTQQPGPPALVDLRAVIDEVAQLRRRDMDTSGIALDIDVQTARKVYANFTEVEQVTLNFVINAQQSIEAAEHPTGRILVRVYDAGKRVRLEVQDDGPGVTPEDEPKLFQPFFTTKPVGKGTGLGLSVSYGIIESYGGVIGHCTNEWSGATFFFELPVSEPAVRPPSSSTARLASKSDDRPPLLHRPVSPGV
jgi:C4-dicarboxylate-specific signal transduction histidine kinase